MKDEKGDGCFGFSLRSPSAPFSFFANPLLSLNLNLNLNLIFYSVIPENIINAMAIRPVTIMLMPKPLSPSGTSA